MDQEPIKKTENFISLSEASKKTGYNQDYLGFLCRTGKLKGFKIERNWVTTNSSLDEFLIAAKTTDENFSSGLSLGLASAQQYNSLADTAKPSEGEILGFQKNIAGPKLEHLKHEVLIALEEKVLNLSSKVADVEKNINEQTQKVISQKSHEAPGRDADSAIALAALPLSNQVSLKEKFASNIDLSVALAGSKKVLEDNSNLKFKALDFNKLLESFKKTKQKFTNYFSWVLGGSFSALLVGLVFVLLTLSPSVKVNETNVIYQNKFSNSTSTPVVYERSTTTPQTVIVENKPVTQNITQLLGLNKTTLYSLIDDRLNQYLSEGKFKGPIGETGPQGPQGIAGTQGPAGTATTLQGGWTVGYTSPSSQPSQTTGSIGAVTNFSSQSIVTDDLRVNDTATINNLTVTNLNTGLTTGSVVFQGSGALSQDNSNFYWDDTNNILSLGTTTIATSSILQLESTDKGFLAPRMTTAQRDAILSPAAGLLVYNLTTQVYNFYNGSSWSAVGTGSGGGSLSGGVKGYVASWASSTELTVGVLIDNGTVAGINASSSAVTLNVQSSPGIDPFNVSSSSGSSFFRVTSSGKTGIGTISPETTLDVAGTIRSTSFLAPSAGAGLELLYNASSNGGTASIYAFDRSSSTYKNLNLNDKAYLTSTGLLGINTTTPMEMLSVQGGNILLSNQYSLRGLTTTGANSAIIGIDSANYASIYSPLSSGGVKIKSATSNDLVTFTNSGLVGIGSSSPVATLSVVGTSTLPTTDILRIASSSGSSYLTVAANGLTTINQLTVNGVTTLSAATTTINGVTYYWPNSLPVGNRVLQSDSSGNLSWVTDQTGAGGSVSGGLTGYVTTWASSTQITYGRLIDNGTVAGMNATSSNVSFNLQSTGGNIDPFNVSSSSGTSYLRVTRLGYIGIGTSTPSYNLDIESNSGSFASSQLRLISQSSGGTASINFTGINGSSLQTYVMGYRGGVTNGFTIFDSTNLVDRLHIGLTGEVGIGTSTASSKLTVVGAAGSNPALTVASSSGASQFVVAASGNVGIGTSTPGALLHVVSSSTSQLTAILQSSAGQTANLLTLQTSTGTILSTFDTSGNLSIGTSSAFGLESGSKGITIDTDGAPSQITLRSAGGSGALAGGNIFGYKAGGSLASPTNTPANTYMLFLAARGYSASGWGTGSKGAIAIQSAETWSDTAQGTFISFDTTQIGSISRTEKLRITDAGNIGIGSSTPTAKLTVVSTAGSTSSVFTITSSSGSSFLTVSSLGNVNIATLTASSLVMSDANKNLQSVTLGSGLSISGSTLNTTQVGGVWTLGNGLIYNATSTDLVGIGTITPTTTLFVQGKGGTNPFAISSSTGTQLLTVTQAGNLGIGTTTPSALQTIAGIAGSTASPFLVASSSGHTLLGVSSGGTVTMGGTASGQNGGLLVQGNSSGGVGITVKNNNTSNFTNANAAISFVESTGGGNMFMGIGDWNGGDGALIRFSIGDSNWNFFQINQNSGRIAIGPANDAPQATLHVKNDVPSTGATSMIIQAGQGQNTTDLLRFTGNAADGNIGSVYTVFTSTGALGIGSSTPIARLTVMGTSTLPTTTLFTVASSSGTQYLTVAANGSTTISSLGAGLVRSTSGGALFTDTNTYLTQSATDLLYPSFSYASSTFPSFTYASSVFATIANYPTYTYASSVFPSFTYGSSTYATQSSLTSYPTLTYASSTFVNYTYASSAYATVRNLVAGTNITITTSTPGQITIAASGGSGNSAFTIGSGLIYNATSTDLVGIGTITPTTTLFIQGKGGTNPFAIASSTGTQLLTVTQAGNVGIGTTTTTEILQINGDMVFGQGGGGYLGDFHGTLAGTNAYFGANIKNVGGTPTQITTDFASWLTRAGANADDYAIYRIPAGGAWGGTPVFKINSSGYVGIGEATPGSKLSVSGNATIGVSYDTLAAPSNGLLVEGFTGIGTSSPVATLAVTGSSSYPSLYIASSSGASQLVVTAAGNVGIGTNTPATRLQVVGTGMFGTRGAPSNYTDGNDVVYFENVAAANYTQFHMYNTDDGNSTTIETLLSMNRQGQTAFWSSGDTSPGLQLWTRTAHPLRFATNNTEVMRITASSTIGIGTTTPNAKLTITSSGTTRPLLVSSSSGTTLLSVDYLGNFNLATLTASSLIMSDGSKNLQSVTLGSGLSFNGSTLNTSANSAFTIGSGLIYNATSTDLVGIGTITPTTTLFVQGKGGTNPFAIASSTGTQLLNVTQAGNVGIGTTTPLAKLQVHEPTQSNTIAVFSQGLTDPTTPLRIKSTDNGGNYEPILETPAALRISSTLSGTTNQFRLLPYQGDIYFQNTNNSGNIYFSGLNAADVNSVNFSSAQAYFKGIVGINTSTPVASLAVKGTTSIPSLYIASSSGASQLVVTSAGNVGIGTGTPSTNLHMVSTAGGFNNTLLIETLGANPVPRLKIKAGSTIWDNRIVGNGNNQYSITYNETSTFLGITTSGLMSVGGAVSDSLSGLGVASNLAVGANYYGAVAAPTNGAIIQGMVGIGTSSPVATLSVMGTSTLPTTALFVVASSSGTSYLTVASNGSTTLSSLASAGCVAATASGDLYITSCGAGSLSGSGTNGQVAYYTGASTLASAAALLNNGTVVGINATSSTISLNVQGSGTLDPFNVSSSSGTSILRVTSSGNVGINTSSPSGIFTIASSSSSTLASLFTILPNGNMGLGVSSPSSPLSTKNSLRVAGDIITGNTILTDSLYTTGGTNYLIAGNPVVLGGGAISNISLKTVNVDRLYVTNYGGVGINTSTPLATLAVQGYSGSTTPTFIVSSSSGTSLLTVASNGSTTISSLSNALPVRSTASGSLFNGAIALGSSDVSGVLAIANGGTATTSSPTVAGQLLSAHGSGSWGVTNLVAGSNITITTTTPGQITIAGSAGSGNSAFTIGSGLIYNATSTDLVGIGTITPTTTLFVQGKGGTNPFGIASSTGTQLVTVTQAGNVGIGTSTPVEMLHLQSGNILISNQYSLRSLTTTGANAALIQIDSADYNTLYSPLSNTGIKFKSAVAGDLMTILNGGNIGIGTSTPAARLVVQNAAGTTDVMRIASSSGQTMIYVSAFGGFVQNISSSTAVHIMDGSTTPASVFVVDTTNASGNAGLDITAGGAQTGNLLNFFSSGGATLLSVTASGGLVQNVASTTAFQIQNGAGSLVFNIDTVGKKIGLGTSTGISAFDIISDISIDEVGSPSTGSGTATGLRVITSDDDSPSVLIRNTSATPCVGQQSGCLTAVAAGSAGILTIEASIATTTATSTSWQKFNFITAYASTTRGAGTAAFRVRGDGAVFAENAYSASGADYAEYFDTYDTGIEAGDIVIATTTDSRLMKLALTDVSLSTSSTTTILSSLSSSTPISTSSVNTLAADAPLVSAIMKSTKAYDNKILGIVSSQAAFIGNNPGGRSDNNPFKKPVGLVGRVPVKVTTENGEIKVGDFVTTSGQFNGYGMKATRSGHVLGIALEDFKPSSVSSSLSTGPIGGTVLVFINPGYQTINNTFVLGENDGQIANATSSQGAVTANSFIIDQKGSGNILQLQKNGMDKFVVQNSGAAVLYGDADNSSVVLSVITASTTMFSINSKGDLTAKGKITVGKDTAGTAVIKSGDSKVTVTFSEAYTSIPKVIVTVQGLPSFFYGVTEKTVNGFTITTSGPVPADFSFDWVALNQPEENGSGQSGVSVVSSPVNQNTNNNQPEPEPTPTPTEGSEPIAEPTPIDQSAGGGVVAPEPDPGQVAGAATEPQPTPTPTPEPAPTEAPVVSDNSETITTP